MKGALPLLLIGAVLLVLSKGGSVQSKPTKPANVDRSLARLRPLLVPRVERVLAGMRARGFKPMVWETGRSPERAQRLAAAGTGVAKSMHVKGLAVDIVDADLRWDATPAFWTALAEEYTRAGMYRVRHRNKDGRLVFDPPHGQACPGYMDAKCWANTDAQNDALLAQRYLVG